MLWVHHVLSLSLWNSVPAENDFQVPGISRLWTMVPSVFWQQGCTKLDACCLTLACRRCCCCFCSRQALKSQVNQAEVAIQRKLVEEAANQKAAAAKGVSCCCPRCTNQQAAHFLANASLQLHHFWSHCM